MSKRFVTICSVLLVSAWVTAVAVGPGAADEGGGAKTPEYIGPKACKKCHFQQHKSWSKTPLSMAFEHLKPDQVVEAKKAAGLDPKKDYTTDPKCLKCHTTGYAKASGYPALVEGKAHTEEEKARAALTEGVTCEACHGPGSLYAPYKKENKDYKQADIAKLGALAPVVETTCAPCHAKECPTMPADYKFDFEKFKASDKLHKHKKLKHKH